MQRQLDNTQQLFDLAVKSSKDTDNAFRQLLDKTVTMLGTKDPLAYQQVMAMNSTYVVPETTYGSSDYDEFMKEQLTNNDPSAVDDEEIDVLRQELGLTS